MKVICINNGPVKNQIGLIHSAHQLIESEKYTVKRECKEAYELEEVETPEGHSGFTTVRFIPCSDIDEMELQTKKELSIANLFKWL